MLNNYKTCFHGVPKAEETLFKIAGYCLGRVEHGETSVGGIKSCIRMEFCEF